MLTIIEEDSLVFDHETGLIWQISDAQNQMTFTEAEQFIRDINRKGFGKFSDWRLPTLEEGMSLVEAEPKAGYSHIDPIFRDSKDFIWTSDKTIESSRSIWIIHFGDGHCDNRSTSARYSVRLVR